MLNTVIHFNQRYLVEVENSRVFVMGKSFIFYLMWKLKRESSTSSSNNR
jgi:hypothetical protein